MSNKYHALRTYSTLCGRYFSSQKEARRGEELALLEKAGGIVNLEYQPKFILSTVPKITYTADFRYLEDNMVVIEDVKGVLTRDTRTKIAWAKEKFGIEIELL